MFFNKKESEPVIEFIGRRDYKGVFPEPVRSSEMIPKWFSDLDLDLNLDDSFRTGTAKRCMPMFDILGAGYMIPLPATVTVKATAEEEVRFWWRTEPEFNLVSTHSQAQVGGLKATGGVYKWTNPWHIVTKPGYSCLFIPPVNRSDPDFEPFSGIVDTDKYINTINFPFRWNKFPYDAVIQAGSVPMIQVIPFKRERWEHVVRYAGQEEDHDLRLENLKVRAYDHQYTKQARSNKKW